MKKALLLTLIAMLLFGTFVISACKQKEAEQPAEENVAPADDNIVPADEVPADEAPATDAPAEAPAQTK